MKFVFLFQPTKLTEKERAELLQPLFSNKWTLVENRDAIYKEYNFSNFIEVCILNLIIISKPHTYNNYFTNRLLGS